MWEVVEGFHLSIKGMICPDDVSSFFVVKGEDVEDDEQGGSDAVTDREHGPLTQNLTLPFKP